MVEISLTQLGLGAVGIIIGNNFVGWFTWRYFDKHLAKHLDKIEDELKRLRRNGS